VVYWVTVALAIAALDAMLRLRKTGKFRLRKNIWRAERNGFLKYITPKPGSRSYEKQKKLIERARLDITVEGLQVIILVGLILGLVIGGAVVYTNMQMKVVEVYSSRSGNILSFIKPGGGEGEDGNNVLLGNMTADVVKGIDCKSYIERGEYRELQKKVYDVVKEKGIDGEYTAEYAKKVYENLIELNDIGFGKNDVLAVIIFGCIGMLLPGKILQTRAKKTLRMMDYELNKLEIITILLLQRENINISSILLRLKAVSGVYRPYLNRCLAVYPENPSEAMKRLQEEVNYRPFTDFINVLKQGIESDRKTTGRVLEMTRRLKNALQEAMERQNIKRTHRNIQLIQYPFQKQFIERGNEE